MSAKAYLAQPVAVPLGTQANPQAPNLSSPRPGQAPNLSSPRPAPLGTQANPQAQSPQVVDFSGKYVDNFGETRVMVQNGSSGECTAGWKYTVSGDVATIVGHGINGKFRAGDPIRKIDWTNGVTYKDALQAQQQAPTQGLGTQGIHIPPENQAPTQGLGTQGIQIPQGLGTQGIQIPQSLGTQGIQIPPEMQAPGTPVKTGAISLDVIQEKERCNTSLGGKDRANTSLGGYGGGMPPGSPPPGSLQVGSYSATGKKPGNPSYVNQDAHAEMNLSGGKVFIGVFDGHGNKGTECSTHVKQTFVEMCPSLATTPDIPGTFRQIYAEAVSRLRRDDMGKDSGATATVALVDAAAQRVYVAHCGDSLCFVLNKSGAIAWMTREHKPSDPQERPRLEANGSTITQNGRLTLNGSDAHFGLARSIGDFVYEKQGVIAEPDISQSMLFEPGCAILMGSDGIWDMVPKEEHAKTVVSMQPQEAAQCIVNTSRGSWEKAFNEGHLAHIDDITAVLVSFVPTEVAFGHAHTCAN